MMMPRKHSMENGEAREAILQSIRTNLKASLQADQVSPSHGPIETKVGSGADITRRDPDSLVDTFQKVLEGIGGHCVVVADESEAAEALKRIISDGAASLPINRIALSDAPGIEKLVREARLTQEIVVNPAAAELFQFDAGITMAQAAIAETGTLVLESSRERHRLVSLVPPTHIAIVNAEDLCATLNDALKLVRGHTAAEMSPAITFITGPSRTADIELTLTIGVHGPKELYVIINKGPRLK